MMNHFSSDDNQLSNYDLLTLTKCQKIWGYWDNLDMINKILKLNVKKIDSMNNIDDEKIKGNCYNLSN